MPKQTLPDLTPQLRLAVLNALITEQGGRTSLFQAAKTVRASLPKRPLLKYSLATAADGSQVLTVQNVGGVQTNPVLLIAQDQDVEKTKQTIKVLLNAGESSVTSLPGLYGEVRVDRIRDKKTVATGTASLRPQLSAHASWISGGQLLEVELHNGKDGGPMRAEAGMIITQGERTLPKKMVKLDTGSSCVSHINADLLVLPNLTTDMSDLTVTVDGFSPITVTVPERPKALLVVSDGTWNEASTEVTYLLTNDSDTPMRYEADTSLAQNDGNKVLLRTHAKLNGHEQLSLVINPVEAGVDPALPIRVVVADHLNTYIKLPPKPEVAVAPPPAPAETPEWVFGEPRWDGAEHDQLVVDVTYVGVGVPNGSIYLDTMPFTQHDGLKFEAGVAVPVQVNNVNKPGQTVRLWIDGKLSHTFIVPELPTPALYVYPVDFSQRWEGDNLVITATRKIGPMAESVFVHLETPPRVLALDVYMEIRVEGDTHEFDVTNASPGDVIKVWIEADPVTDLLVPEKPSANDAPVNENLTTPTPVATGTTQADETAYM